MIRFLSVAVIACRTVGLAQAAPIYWEDWPGVAFHAQSTVDAPCGIGTPRPGHFADEVTPSSLPHGLTLTVKQDPHRLCYVFGTIPEAPVIRVRQGQELAITLRNEITDPAAIGGTVAIAHLDEPNKPAPTEAGFYPVIAGTRHQATGVTNLHVHGFAVSPVAPQDEVLNTCVDPAAGPAICGRREFTYHYHIPANMPAGLYWYHPHIHGEVQAQMLMGLSGAIVVEGRDDDARRAAGIQDRIFIVRQSQDLDLYNARLSAAPAHQPAAPDRPAPTTGAAAPADRGPIDTARELRCSSNTGVDEITLNGSRVLDGAVQDSDLAHFEIAQGKTQLWRVLNAATDAFLDLALIDEDGKPLPIEIVARDGAPLTDDSGKRLNPGPTTESQLVPPSGRLEFLIPAPPAGRKIYFVTHAVDTGCAGDKVPERRLALVTAAPMAAKGAATEATAAMQPSPPMAQPAADSFSGLLSRKTDRERIFALAEYPRPGSEEQTDFYIVERRPGAVLRPFEMGAPPAITVKAGSVEEWVIENWTNELHAFHIHQVHFRLLALNGSTVANPPLLDVVNVPYATPTASTDGDCAVVPGRVRIKIWFPEALAGDIPFHCHLVDHEDNGMMAVLRVLPTKPANNKAELSPADLLRRPPMCGPGLRSANRASTSTTEGRDAPPWAISSVDAVGRSRNWITTILTDIMNLVEDRHHHGTASQGLTSD